MNGNRNLKGGMNMERGRPMEEVKMLVSGYVVKDQRRIVRVSFIRGTDYAEGTLPDGVIDKSKGFSEEEKARLCDFLQRMIRNGERSYDS